MTWPSVEHSSFELVVVVGRRCYKDEGSLELSALVPVGPSGRVAASCRRVVGGRAVGQSSGAPGAGQAVDGAMPWSNGQSDRPQNALKMDSLATRRQRILAPTAEIEQN